MLKKIKTFFVTFASVLALLAPALAMPAVAHAAVTTTDLQSGLCGGTNLQVNSQSCSSTTSGADTTINKTIRRIIDIFSVVVGIIAVIMIIIGGVKYVLSGGASDQVSSAKNTILFAIVGLVIVALAQVIVKFVLNKVTAP